MPECAEIRCRCGWIGCRRRAAAVAGRTRLGRGRTEAATTAGALGLPAGTGSGAAGRRYSPSVANSIARSKPLRAAEAKRILADGNMCSQD